MKIQPTCANQNFQARIKISKDKNNNARILGAGTVTTGATSLYIGSDAFQLVPTEFVKTMCENIENEHIVNTAKGLVVVNNEGSAISNALIMGSSLPSGVSITPLGLRILHMGDKCMKNRSIPS